MSKPTKTISPPLEAHSANEKLQPKWAKGLAAAKLLMADPEYRKAHCSTKAATAKNRADKAERIAQYELDARCCLECGEEISYQQVISRNAKFCAKQCAGAFNNVGRERDDLSKVTTAISMQESQLAAETVVLAAAKAFATLAPAMFHGNRPVPRDKYFGKRKAYLATSIDEESSLFAVDLHDAKRLTYGHNSGGSEWVAERVEEWEPFQVQTPQVTDHVKFAVGSSAHCPVCKYLLIPSPDHSMRRTLYPQGALISGVVRLTSARDLTVVRVAAAIDAIVCEECQPSDTARVNLARVEHRKFAAYAAEQLEMASFISRWLTSINASEASCSLLVGGAVYEVNRLFDDKVLLTPDSRVDEPIAICAVDLAKHALAFPLSRLNVVRSVAKKLRALTPKRSKKFTAYRTDRSD